jgi:hypothetical protein
MRVSQSKISRPRSSASRRNALVQYGSSPLRLGGPYGALPTGALMRRIATWSTPSWRAAFAMTGSMSMMPCMPPGWLCARRGGVFVSTVVARMRIAGGWYRREMMRPVPMASLRGSYPLFSPTA